MPKLGWDDYVTQYPNSVGLMAVVARQLPKGAPKLDKNQKVVLTPYKLFLMWLDGTLQGDWAAMPTPSGFVVRVATQSDIQLIIASFPAHTRAIKTEYGPLTYGIAYRDSDYGRLAGLLGYVF